MTTAFRLAWKVQRWELSLLVGSGLALTAIALLLPSLGEAASGDQRMIVLFLTVAGPVVLGSALGIGLVAGDIEQRTASLAWSLAGSRLRWLWLRVWPVVAIGLVVGVLLGAATARLMDLTSPSDIFMHQMRGPVVAMRFVTAFGVAVLIGAVVRRVMPSLLLAIVATVALSIGTAIVLRDWQEEQATLVPFSERTAEPVIALLDHEFATAAPDGTLTVTEPECSTQAECMEAMAGMTQAMVIVPARTYGSLLAIEAGIAVAILAVSALGTAAIINRWGPR